MNDEREMLVQALQLDHHGDWDGAHRIVQRIENADSYWIHAYLHRKEGDLANAGYWYRRASRSMPETSLEQEWRELMDHVQAGG